MAGVAVYVRASWVVIAVVIAILLEPRVEHVQPGLGAWKYVAGFVFAGLLYSSILLHEMSHAVVAQRVGLRVRSISLHFLGGSTEIEGESRTAAEEFKIAVVGPLTSFAVGLAALGLLFLDPSGLTRLALEGIAGANLVIGVLNLVPGLPLDGGRVLKSAVWQVSGNMHRGTIVAAWGGRVVGLLALLWPFVAERITGVEQSTYSYLFAFMIAAFLWTGATASMMNARLRIRLPSLQARRLARRAVAVPDDLSVSEAVRRAQEAAAGGIVAQAGSGALVSIVNEAALLALPEDRRPWVPVSSVARTLTDGLVLPADLGGEDLIRAMSRTPAAEYVLVEPDGSLYGLLVTADVDEAFEAGAGR
ncbi:site-2 protease family protein [Nocardioides marmoriginsengisoli]|uniref:Zinc metalloprotease n=1 Tax=Nocardioides marmoriginsengisoli TaxID=661483 RepID=A0A3N0CQL8_9ACTN|nr:site-2 protease family protein [Nocardioides marmoriginsengisoli]